jgi:hypothetical protein
VEEEECFVHPFLRGGGEDQGLQRKGKLCNFFLQQGLDLHMTSRYDLKFLLRQKNKRELNSSSFFSPLYIIFLLRFCNFIFPHPHHH